MTSTYTKTNILETSQSLNGIKLFLINIKKITLQKYIQMLLIQKQ